MVPLGRPAVRLVAIAAALALSSHVLTAADDWRGETAAWRAKREVALRAPDGWLAVAGLFFLKPGINTVGAGTGRDVQLPAGSADAGRIVVDGDAVRFEPSAGVEARLGDQAISAPVALRTYDAASKRQPDRVSIGRVAFHLHRSGERLAVRLRDPESRLRAGFTGLAWFPLDERWRVSATFTPHAAPKPVEMLNVLGDVERSASPGEVSFTVDGRTVRLQALDAGDQLWFVFTDATAGRETYETRFLYADRPDAHGRVTLDFNRAYNPPCAYNPHTTCPLPVAQNRLKVRIPAGERRYPGDAPAHRPTASEGSQP